MPANCMCKRLPKFECVRHVHKKLTLLLESALNSESTKVKLKVEAKFLFHMH